MKNRYLLISILINISSFVYSQSVDSLPQYITMYQKVVYVKSDTIINVTRFNEQNGSFFFSQGCLDSSSLLERSIYYIEKGKSYKNLLKYSEVNTIEDTLKSFFPIMEVDYEKHSNVDIQSEVLFSHILNKSGEKDIHNKSNQNVVRFIYPCDETNLSSSYYLVKIHFLTDSVSLSSVFLQSNDISGIKIIQKNSVFLKSNEIKKIEKLLGKIENPYHECSKYGNPWLIESNFGEYKYHIISYNCVQRKDEDLEPIVNLYYMLRSINRKYFGNNCPNGASVSLVPIK